MPVHAPDLDAAREAMARGAWTDARTRLEQVVAAAASPQALEELGLAAWWLDDATLTFDSRERAYTLYRDAGDARSAARVAIWLVWDNLAFRGDFAVASGWLERARRLLADQHRSVEYGWLLIREGEVALFRGHDPSSAIESARRAAALGRDVGDRAVEFTALALEGLALVSAGDAAAGMRCLDEATVAATAGEVKEMHAVGLVVCWQMFACERMRDYDRASQWVARVNEFTKRWGLRPLSAVCRTQYAGVLLWRGEWDAAEQELQASTRELERARPGMAAPPIARLGELRLRQGRVEEAARLFEQAASQPVARLGRSTLLLDAGDADQALGILRQHLEEIGANESTMRAGALELLVRTYAATGDLAAADAAFAELNAIADAVGTAPLLASSAMARGWLQRSRDDHAGAASCFEKAAELFEQSGAPFETARASLERARSLAALGRRGEAEREARGARQSFAALGAARDADRARDVLHELGSPAPRASRAARLTSRQVEILQLVATGMSNVEIARRLRLSEHTVKRHVANLLTKLGLGSRAAAAAFAAKEGLL